MGLGIGKELWEPPFLHLFTMLRHSVSFFSNALGEVSPLSFSSASTEDDGSGVAPVLQRTGLFFTYRLGSGRNARYFEKR